ncbi:HEAT repeat domain-containing protein [Motilimonas eburnea]|uniref:HEAT repeat domain-containing protein n=1 Tax=Motilimonas eburnea TaxID=1737488 RepID=UPI001E3D57D5|nr:HEAT repeat domain-containing protein [Motilimonas eburnea]MCE2572201.1 HEAT repeat domain-containing protein [Motilimonas eburnea]
MKLALVIALGISIVLLAPWVQATQCQRQYQFSINTQTHFSMQSPLPSSLTMKGVISITPVQYQEQAWWGVKADNVILTSNGINDRDPSFEAPFAFQIDKQGLIKAFWFAPHLSANQQQQLQGFAYYFQYLSGPNTTKAKPTRLEQDNLGQYQVRYSTNQQQQLQMQKTAYRLTQASAANAFRHIEVKQSLHTITPEQCWFSQRHGTEQLNLIGQADELSFNTKQSYQLSLLSQAQPSELFSLPAKVEDWPVNNQPTLSEAQLNELSARLDHFLTNTDLLALDGFSLAAKLREFDAVLQRLPDTLNQLNLSDKAQMRLFNALGQVDSPQSQLTLVRFIDHQDSAPNTRFRALRALENGQAPLGNAASQAIIDLLQNTSELGEQAGSFIMTLGAMLGRRQDNENSQLISEQLLDKLTTSKDDNLAASIITAFANSADEQYTDVVLGYTNSPSSAIQKASARALGSFATPRAYQGLQTMLTPERKERVQQAVLTSLGNYQLDTNTRKDVYQYAATAKQDKVRYAAIQALANQHYADRNKQLRTLLNNETSRRNFTAIVKALHQKP